MYDVSPPELSCYKSSQFLRALLDQISDRVIYHRLPNLFCAGLFILPNGSQEAAHYFSLA